MFVSRGRDVMLLMQKEGEMGMKKAIIKIAEDNEMMRQELAKLVETVGTVIMQLRAQLEVFGEHSKAFDQFRKTFHPDNEANPDQPWSKP